MVERYMYAGYCTGWQERLQLLSDARNLAARLTFTWNQLRGVAPITLQEVRPRFRDRHVPLTSWSAHA